MNVNIKQTWKHVNGVHHLCDEGQIHHRHVEVQRHSQLQIHFFSGELLHSDWTEHPRCDQHLSQR